MKKGKIVSALLVMFVTLPIWYYLLYQVLVRVQATELMFFLYFIYVPVGIFAHLVSSIVSDD